MREQVVVRPAVRRRAKVTFDNGVTRIVEYETKPALKASKCASCGRIYQMDSWGASDYFVGMWSAIMHKAPCGEGNTLELPVCSYACAHELSTGRWRDVDSDEVRGFVEVDAFPFKVTCILGHLFKDEKALVRVWEDSPERTPHTLSLLEDEDED